MQQWNIAVKFKKLGYKVCSQLVSVTAYNDEELLQVE